MATNTQAVEAFGKAGLDPATVFAVARYLRGVGFWPKAGRGGGKAAAHVGAGDLVSFILGMAGEQPVDAPRARLELAPLIYQGPRRESNLSAGNDLLPVDAAEALEARSTFQVYLEDWITRLAQMDPEARAAKEARLQAQDMALTLAPSARRAWISSETEGGRYLVHDFAGTPSGDAQQARIVMRRDTTFSVNLIFVAAELLADTLARHRDLLLQEGEALAGASPESRNPTLAGVGLTGDWPSTSLPTGTADTPEGRERGRNSQPLSPSLSPSPSPHNVERLTHDHRSQRPDPHRGPSASAA